MIRRRYTVRMSAALLIDLLLLVRNHGGKPLVLIGQALGILPQGMPGGMNVLRRVLGSEPAKVSMILLKGKLETMSRAEILGLLKSAGSKAAAAMVLLAKLPKKREPESAEGATDTDQTDLAAKVRELLNKAKGNHSG